MHRLKTLVPVVSFKCTTVVMVQHKQEVWAPGSADMVYPTCLFMTQV